MTEVKSSKNLVTKWLAEADEDFQWLSKRVSKHTLRALKKYLTDHDMTTSAFITEALEKALKDKGAL